MTPEPYVPNEQQITERSFASEDEARRGIARIKADALREWADFQRSALHVSGHVLDSDEWYTARA